MRNFSKRLLTSMGLLLIIFFSFLNNIVLFLSLFTILFILFYEFFNILKKIYKKKYNLIFFFLLVIIIYLFYFVINIWIFLIEDDYLSKQKIIFILGICISTDIGGYIFGKILKGKKLTSISPNKTYSGVLGSFILSLLFVYVFFIDINYKINLFLLTVIISFISQIGDLFISLLKRKAKIKDSGSFLPGHGGLLDRLDGILFALPVGLILVSL